MKKCPACGYADRGGGACAVCGRDLSAVADVPEQRPARDPRMLVVTGVLLLCCLAAFFATGRGGRPAPSSPAAGLNYEAAFGYEGVLYSLDRLAELKFLPAEDKARVLPLLKSPDARVACAAVRLTGGWLRAGTVDPPLFTSALGSAAVEGHPDCRVLAEAELAWLRENALARASAGQAQKTR